jgi:hypothetical protein
MPRPSRTTPQHGRGGRNFNLWLGVNSCDFAARIRWTIMVANDDLLLHEPHLISSVLSACRRSYRYAAKHRAEWADFGARCFRIPRSTMTRSIERELPDLYFDCEVDWKGSQRPSRSSKGSAACPLPFD